MNLTREDSEQIYHNLKLDPEDTHFMCIDSVLGIVVYKERIHNEINTTGGINHLNILLMAYFTYDSLVSNIIW